MTFRVIIDYRETTYELRAGTRKEPFQAVFTVDAENAEAAEAQAVSKRPPSERTSLLTFSHRRESFFCG